jgi:signal transduction histidine kinase
MDNQTEYAHYAPAILESATPEPCSPELTVNLCGGGGGSNSLNPSYPLPIRRRRSCHAPTRMRALVRERQLNDELLAVFSHEVRSSLGAIGNAAHLLRIRHAEKSVEDKARLLIERQVGRMTRLIDDLLASSRVRCAELPLKSERIDLRAVAMHAIGTVESDLAQRNHRLTASLPDAPIWLAGDPGRLEQVLVNLLVNASKYTNDGGDISLSAQLQDRAVVVRVRDSGIGIAPDVLPRVFDLFMQADHSSRRAEAGLGIGLALVKNLVEMHGGSVTAASAGLGQGSEFVVRLPVLGKRAIQLPST